MAAVLEIESTTGFVCYKCGTVYPTMKANFPGSYAVLYKGRGVLPYCKKCVTRIHKEYSEECGDTIMAAHQVCKKLDIFWDEDVFREIEKKNPVAGMMLSYITRMNTSVYAGKTYEDYLRSKELFWDILNYDAIIKALARSDIDPSEVITSDDIDITQDIIDYWGPGYTRNMYVELEQRRLYWSSNMPDNMDKDIGTEALIRQICSLEIDINRARTKGLSIEKQVSALNTLLGSMNLKPAQKKEEQDASIETTPMGVWIRRFENERPISTPDPELQDVDKIKKYITVWCFGHLCKMLGIKNSYCKLYEDEIARYKVDRPEFSDEDDDMLLSNIFESDYDESNESYNNDNNDQ